MSSTKIQVGYGSGGRKDNSKKGMYGSRRSGKFLQNGGFNKQPTVSFDSIEQDEWDRIFGKKED